MPQCAKGKWWTDAEMEAQALAALDQSVKEFHGDADRIYLTGLSMGGYGSWSLAAKYPAKWAAAVVVCGGIRIRRGATGEGDTADPERRGGQGVGAEHAGWRV